MGVQANNSAYLKGWLWRLIVATPDKGPQSSLNIKQEPFVVNTLSYLYFRSSLSHPLLLGVSPTQANTSGQAERSLWHLLFHQITNTCPLCVPTGLQTP